MRPNLLFYLFSDIQFLKGIGPKLAERFENLHGRRVLDLINLRPVHYLDRRKTPPISQTQDGEIVSLKMKVVSHEKPPKLKSRRTLPYKILCQNESGFLTLIYFNYKGDYLDKTLPVGEERIISGKIEMFGSARQMTHPDIVAKPEEAHKYLRVEPQYPLTAGLFQRTLHKVFEQILPKLPELPEWQKKPKISWNKAMHNLHEPKELTDAADAIERLAADELLALQLTQSLVRQNVTKVKGTEIKLYIELYKKFVSALPFGFTGGQQSAIDEIFTDMQSGNRMFRLIQGDVGCGKTAVALAAMIAAAGSKKQSAIMVPTTLLALQQRNWIESVVKDLGLKVAMLTSNEKGKAREETLEKIKNGEIDILVGTHALFQDWVDFKELGLVVIDEQHRFGVIQRMKLSQKNEKAHILLMTATPIPRTLTIAMYGEMDVTRITEKPAGRIPIETLVIPDSKMDSTIESMKRAVANGEKIYWICPLVEESEKSDLAAATDRYQFFETIFGNKVGLVHGRMKEDAKTEVLQKFIRGEHQLLIATKVVEVGIDVKDATVMFIEHSERFGLSQLHQLRGRVGRGSKKSTCILIYSGRLSEESERRLKALKQYDDGFKIAEEDLKIRGGGDMLGTRQSGFKLFNFAQFPEHSHILEEAHNYAREIIENDPKLKGKTGEAARVLLSLFEYDESLSYISAG